MLQSYILSTTTETNGLFIDYDHKRMLQSYILSTTTETSGVISRYVQTSSFNRTSFQQQLKRHVRYYTTAHNIRFNRTSFQQQLKLGIVSARNVFPGFNRTSFQQQLKRSSDHQRSIRCRLQSYILSTTTETSGLR